MAHGERLSDIERDIEARRESLTQTLDELQDRIAPEHLVQGAASALRAEGAVLGRAVLRRARHHPVATAMVAAGLAWLVLAPEQTPNRRTPTKTRRGLRAVPPAPTTERRRARPPRGPVPAGRPAPQAASTGEAGERRTPTHDVRGTPVAMAAPSHGQ